MKNIPNKKQIFCLIAFCCIVWYLLVGRKYWFADWNKQAEIGDSPIYLYSIDLSQKQAIEWRVPKEKWNYEEGEAELSLVFDRVKGLPENIDNRNRAHIHLNVRAYGLLENGQKYNRLVQNFYYNTDKPFSADARLFSFFNSKIIEHGLGAVNIYPRENTYIVIDITNPDPALNIGHPRLKLVGKHDYAVYEGCFMEACLGMPV